MPFPTLLVAIPHSGTAVPPEIPLNSLIDNFPALARNMDWFTNWLYDFRDILGNRQAVFPYCSLLLEANRHPDRLDDAVPLADIHGEPLYKPGREPPPALRRTLADRYLRPYHNRLESLILSGADFLLDGHATVSARGVAENQIELMNTQHAPLDPAPLRFCPPAFIETYAAELRRRLPDIRVTVNASGFDAVYGHVCAAHAVDAMSRVGPRAPAILQETHARLFTGPDGAPDLLALNRLRRAFAESLAAACQTVRTPTGSPPP